MAFECCNNCKTPLEAITRPTYYNSPAEIGKIKAEAVITSAGMLMYCPRCGNVQVLLKSKEDK